LSSSLTLSQIIDAYEEKYATRNPAMVIKALDYHNDINFNEPVEMLKGKYRWEDIKKRLGEITLSPGKLFGKIMGTSS
jgi:hypothetical protein